MRFPGKTPPQTAAQRQAKCRAIKRGTYYNCQVVTQPPQPQPQLPPAPPPSQATRALPAPAAPPAPPAIRKKSPSSDSTSLALLDGPLQGGQGGRLCLPAGVAARLRSLLDQHKSGKTLTAAERAEAEGLLDIAEYFAVQRLRQQFAA